MSFSRSLIRIVVFVVLTLTIGMYIITTKSSLLLPMIKSCPAAISDILNIFSAIKSPDRFMSNVWSCGIGILLYIGLPGIGISWFLAKLIT